MRNCQYMLVERSGSLFFIPDHSLTDPNKMDFRTLGKSSDFIIEDGTVRKNRYSGDTHRQPLINWWSRIRFFLTGKLSY